MDGQMWRPDSETYAARAPVILLVEDDPDDERLARELLRRAGIANAVVVAHDGEEALDYLLGVDREVRTLPQFVLLDLKVPRVHGIEVLRRLRADPRTERLPVMTLISSNEERAGVDPSSLAGCTCVRKPIDFSDFVAAAGQLRLSWVIVESPPATG